MSAFAASKILVMQPGETAVLGGLKVRLDSLGEVAGPNYRAVAATFTVTQRGRERSLVSEKRFYPVSRNQTTEAGIVSGILGNAYVAIGDTQEGPRGQGLVVRIYNHPLVGWIWFGGLMMAMGGAASLADRRYRIGAPATRAVPVGPALAPAE
jgi:cytochrome c-type biogenesis protein CcmF